MNNKSAGFTCTGGEKKKETRGWHGALLALKLNVNEKQISLLVLNRIGPVPREGVEAKERVALPGL